MDWKSSLNGDPLPWLLEKDEPGPRYLAMRDLLDLPTDDPELMKACNTALSEGPIATILAKMDPKGYWSKPGPGYNPKYYSTVWSLITLAQLGASTWMDTRISTACAYILDKSLSQQGQFSFNGVPSGTVDCLQGNLCMALMTLGYEDPRLAKAYEWMARSVTGEGLSPNTETNSPLRYYAYKCGPLFACGANGNKPCAWGATKVMLAFACLPSEQRTALIKQAIQRGVDFFFSTDPSLAEYPTRTGAKPSRDWWKFGFPIFYVTDLLQVAEALSALGYGADPRLLHTFELILKKQDMQGRWALEYDYTGKTWVDFGPKMNPNKWVTLRVLKVLRMV